MEFSKPILDIIKERTSRRSYENKSLDTSVKEKILGLLEKPVESPFGATCAFKWISVEGVEAAQKKKLGTYGFITGARNYIAGIVNRNEPLAVEHLGYALEKIILHATDSGLGTCWLAGFNRIGFGEQAKLDASQKMPAITPIGYSTDRRITESMIRLVINANHRKPWAKLFFEGNFTTPLSVEKTGEFSDVLEGVRLGPSAKNGQPWRIVKSKDEASFHFYAAGGLLLDRGIAACHFDLVVKEKGIDGSWAINDPGIAVPEDVTYVISWLKN